MKNYKTKLDAMRRLLDNIEFHTNYNHPTEAAEMLKQLMDKVNAIQTEVESDE
jgi:hypothetical protein